MYLNIFTVPQIVVMTSSHIQADQELKIRLEGSRVGALTAHVHAEKWLTATHCMWVLCFKFLNR